VYYFYVSKERRQLCSIFTYRRHLCSPYLPLREEVFYFYVGKERRQLCTIFTYRRHLCSPYFYGEKCTISMWTMVEGNCVLFLRVEGICVLLISTGRSVRSSNSSSSSSSSSSRDRYYILYVLYNICTSSIVSVTL
jgi:hypothetical protein